MSERNANWIFNTFLSPGTGAAIVQDWIDDLSEEAKQELETTLDYLQILPLDKWSKPEGKVLKEGLSEIRFDADQAPHRIYGFPWPTGALYRWNYTMLHAHNKAKGRSQQDQIALAKKRKKQLERKEANYAILRFQT